MHEMYLTAWVMRFRRDKTCGRHLGSDCDDDHISTNKAEPNYAICLGKLRRSACISRGQDCAMTYCMPILSFAVWHEQVFDVIEGVCEFVKNPLVARGTAQGHVATAGIWFGPDTRRRALKSVAHVVEQVGEEPESARRGETHQETHRQERRL
jgi:hypothetical protein